MAKKPEAPPLKMPDSMFYMMLALTVPRHGYGIMKYVEEITDGIVKIGPGTLYTNLTKMEESLWIEERSDIEVIDDRRVPYSLTPAGRTVFMHELERREKQVWQGKQALMKGENQDE
jgi:DNA-binding PadR family transcriptional regulator